VPMVVLLAVGTLLWLRIDAAHVIGGDSWTGIEDGSGNSAVLAESASLTARERV
jgi:hypothetical protein